MAYKINQHNSFEKGFKKIDAQHQPTVIAEIDELVKDPNKGETTKGALHKLGFKKLKITSTNPEYRVLYRVVKCEKPPVKDNKFICASGIAHSNLAEYNGCNGVIDFALCGTREMFNNLYKLPMDKVKKYL